MLLSCSIDCFFYKPLCPPHRVKDLAALEEKYSLLQSELVVKRQTVEKLQLQKDLLEQEKDEFAMALEKVWTPYS